MLVVLLFCVMLLILDKHFNFLRQCYTRLKYYLLDTEDILLKTRFLFQWCWSSYAILPNSITLPSFLWLCSVEWNSPVTLLEFQKSHLIFASGTVWSLSLRTHIEILHSCADLQSVYNMIHLHAQKFLNRTSSSSSLLMHAVFHDSPVYTFAGLNLVYGAHYKKCIRMMINIVQMLLFIRFWCWVKKSQYH